LTNLFLNLRINFENQENAKKFCSFLLNLADFADFLINYQSSKINYV